MDKGIILKRILEKQDVTVLLGFLWHSSGPGGCPTRLRVPSYSARTLT